MEEERTEMLRGFDLTTNLEELKEKYGKFGPFRDIIEENGFEKSMQIIEIMNQKSGIDCIKLTNFLNKALQDPSKFSKEEILDMEENIIISNLAKIILERLISEFNTNKEDFTKNESDIHFNNEIFKIPLEKFLKKYEDKIKNAEKRSDENRKQVISEIQTILEREFYNRQMGSSYNYLKSKDRKMAFLKYFRNPDLEEEPLPDVSTLLHWESKVFGSKNKASVGYLKYLFVNFLNIRMHTLENLENFIMSKSYTRTIELMNCILNIFAVEYKFKKGNGYDEKKAKKIFKTKENDKKALIRLKNISFEIWSNGKFKLPWPNVLLEKALNHFKTKLLEILLDLYQSEKCKDSIKNEKNEKNIEREILNFQVRNRFNDLYKKLEFYRIGTSQFNDEEIFEKLRDWARENGYQTFKEIGSLLEEIKEKFDQRVESMKEEFKKAKKKLKILKGKEEEIQTEELKKLDELIYQLEETEKDLRQVNNYIIQSEPKNVNIGKLFEITEMAENQSVFSLNEDVEADRIETRSEGPIQKKVLKGKNHVNGFEK